MNNRNMGEYLRTKFNNKGLQGHEMVVAIIALAKAGSIKEEEIKPILLEVFEGDIGQAIHGLSIAGKIIDQDLMDSIVRAY